MDYRTAYGDAYERFPLVERLVYKADDYYFMQGDLETSDLSLLLEASPPIDVIYSDPPWNAANATAFRTKALKGGKVHFPVFLETFCKSVTGTDAKVFFVEMGYKEVENLTTFMKRCGVEKVGVWNTFYGPKNPTLLWLGVRDFTHKPALVGSPTDMHGKDVVRWAFNQFGIAKDHLRVLDPCSGLGMTFDVGMEFGVPVTGMELAARRLANVAVNLIDHGHVPEPVGVAVK